jgi:2-keto-4-pentenoate hydratase
MTQIKLDAPEIPFFKMTPLDILDHLDRAALWPANHETVTDLATGYQRALAVRSLRQARGEVARGYKIGFTNPGIWERYKVFAPIWGTVWDSTLTMCERTGQISLDGTCQPRIEPEIVFGMKACPAPQGSPQALFDAIDWVAPGFEIVQSHLPDWKFQAPDTVADGALHARLLVGPRQAVHTLADNAAALDRLLAAVPVALYRQTTLMEEGCGANVLGSPLRALAHFLKELRQCPGAPDLEAGDVITTGTCTDAWPVQPGQPWRADFGPQFGTLNVRFH